MKKFIKLLSLFMIMAVIFYLSSQPGSESLVTTNILIEFIYNLFPDSLSISLQEFSERLCYPTRMLAHFMEFLALGIAAYINSVEYIEKKNVLYSFVFGSIYAISDEIHQLFVANRVCDIKDMLIDIFGVFVGICLMYRLYHRCIKKD